MWKELGTHLGTVKRKVKEVLENIKDELIYIPFLQNLEMHATTKLMMHSELMQVLII